MRALFGGASGIALMLAVLAVVLVGIRVSRFRETRIQPSPDGN
jgi:hypothetical protein